jgi:flagellar hook-associated protein 1 FlgK
MPTLTSGISIALQAVLTQSQVLEITEHNVANASTPGYRRQSALLTAAAPAAVSGSDSGGGAGQKGSGVSLERIQRFNLDFFDARYRSVSAETGSWEAQSGILSQLEPALAETTDGGLLPRLDAFWAGWQSLSADPASTDLRAVLLADAGDLATAIRSRAGQLTQMRSDQNQAVVSQVDEVNTLAGQVAQLNGEISRVLSVGDQPNDLLDKRDLALDQLAGLAGAVSFEQKNGEMVVSAGGHVLVMGREAFTLGTRANAADTSVVDLAWADGQAFVPPSGKLKGLLEVRDRVLTGQLAGLNTLAAGLISQVNSVHKTGFGLNNATGNDFFTGTDAGSLAVNPLLDAASLAASSGANQAGNNAVALQMAGLKAVKGMQAGAATLNEFYTSQITTLALTTRRAADHSQQYGLVAKALSDQRESVAGVSLDEEAANMAKTQKAYQAAARVLTAYDELLDLVINRMGLVGR